MTISLITTTRDRPLCFSILERWMARQTRKWDQWLVINDSDHPEAYRYTMGQQVIVRSQDGDSLPSICENWLAAVPHVTGDFCFAIEDDDYYAPTFLACMADHLEEVDLVGLCNNVYFKLATRQFVQMHNSGHASLASTAFRRSLLPHVERICKVFKSVFIDMYLWAEYGTAEDYFPGTTRLIPQPPWLQVGMKNMPGAKGLGLGHQPGGSFDPSFSKLKEWLGEDSQVYVDLWHSSALKP